MPTFLPVHRRRATHLVALLLFVLATLAPGVSRAMTAWQGAASPWSVVCTTTAPDGTPTPGDGVAHAMDHCPLCRVQGHAPALPPTAALAVLPLALSQAVPALFLAAPRPLFAWSAHAPRGPPRTI
jgi:hypothetical protein